jgi:hypothetical protein
MTEPKNYTWKELTEEFKLNYWRLRRFIRNHFDDNEVAFPKHGRKTLFTASEYSLIKEKLT